MTDMFTRGRTLIEVEHGSCYVMNSGYVHTVQVSNEHRRKGQGTLLMLQVCAYADTYGLELRLMCLEEWLRNWYATFGFVVVDPWEGYTFPKGYVSPNHYMKRSVQ